MKKLRESGFSLDLQRDEPQDAPSLYARIATSVESLSASYPNWSQYHVVIRRSLIILHIAAEFIDSDWEGALSKVKL